MRTTLKTIAALLVAMLVQAAQGQPTIVPTPQQTIWTGTTLPMPQSVKIVGEATADSAAVALLRQTFHAGRGAMKIIVGKRGDKAVRRYADRIPQRPEGYYINIGKKAIILAGNDAAGTYYAAQTLRQMAAQKTLREGEISDWPAIAERGLVEGYYGNPYSDTDRRRMFDFFGDMKMNTYIYGPKDDAYHRSRWRDPYPEAEAARISQYVGEAARHKVRFVWAIHPGGDIRWTLADSLAIVGKLEKMYALGVRDFAVFFDDIGGDGTDPRRQAGLLNYISEQFIDRHADARPLILCPTQYNRAWSGGDYLDILGQQCRSDIRIMWTGNSVVDMINREDMEWINARLRRNAYIWLNYPVNDYCIGHLLMGPTYGNDLDIAPLYGGFTSNPMEYAEASKLSLYSIADYCWNPVHYDSQTSWQRAISALMPEHTDDFRFFCEENIDLGPTYHGLRRDGESPRFRAAQEQAAALAAKGDTLGGISLMQNYFQSMGDAAERLIGSSENRPLIEEITPWCMVMKIVGDKGVLLQQMRRCLVDDDSVQLVDNYLKYKQLDAEQTAVRSRDFEGSIKKPNPEVATTFVAPYLKTELADLVQRYKRRHGYRTDVFPQQTIENGIYLIKYKGLYLTNTHPNEPGSAPQFVARRDDVKPQSQEWSISLDPATDRYRIVSQLDSRYLNEACRFAASQESNPYDASWHTFEIAKTSDGSFTIRNAGNGGRAYWSASDKSLTISPVNITEKTDPPTLQILPNQ